jgi:transposase
MPPARFIRLKPEEDARLREIEQDAHLKPKVRMRAQVLRLSARGETMQRIAAYTGRSPASIGRDLDRWEGRGLEGLADKTAPGNPTRVTEEVKIFMENKLAQERTSNATQLAEALEGRFGIGAGPEAIRQHLVAMGYSWKRTRYVPSKPPNPEEERETRKELEALKKGPSWRARSS